MPKSTARVLLWWVASVLLALLPCRLVVAGAIELSFFNLAGAVGGGYRDGPAAQARFYSPGAVVADAAGNLYVSDQGGSVVRVIRTDGSVDTLTGHPGVFGLNDGPGSSASLIGSTGLTLTPDGRILAAAGPSLRSITLDGSVRTIAGGFGQSGSVDGDLQIAGFDEVSDLVLDAEGNAFVSEATQHTIRWMSPCGWVSTLAGEYGVLGSFDGVGIAARFNRPAGLALTQSGSLVVADQQNATLRRIERSGVVSTIAGRAGTCGRADGVGVNAELCSPGPLAADPVSGDIYVGDVGNFTVRKLAANGMLTTVAGVAGVEGDTDGPAGQARFGVIQGLAFAAGQLFVSDGSNHVIRRIDATGTVTTWSGLAGGVRSLLSPGVGRDGRGATARLVNPVALSSDGVGGTLVADAGDHTIRAIDASGNARTIAGTHGAAGTLDGVVGLGRLSSPGAVATHRDGRLYIADTGNHAIRVRLSDGTLTTLCGTPGVSGSRDGQGIQASFNAPGGIVADPVDPLGSVYVADTKNHTIRRVTPQGQVTTVVGEPGQRGDANGPGRWARLDSPQGLAVDANGILYIADSQNRRIRRLLLNGQVETVVSLDFEVVSVVPDPVDGGFWATMAGALVRVDASNSVTIVSHGTAMADGWTDGALSTVRFGNVGAVALGPQGQLFVADRKYGAVRVGLPQSSDSARIDCAVSSPQSARALSATAGGADRWNWTVVRRPSGSLSQLSRTDVANPLFIPDRPGTYGFELVAHGPLGAAVSTVELTCLGTTANLSPSSSCTGRSLHLHVSEPAPGAPGPGLPLGFQWLRDGAPIPGAAAATLEFASLAPGDAGRYSCAVASGCGSWITQELEVEPLVTAPVPAVSGALHMGKARFGDLVFRWTDDPQGGTPGYRVMSSSTRDFARPWLLLGWAARGVAALVARPPGGPLSFYAVIGCGEGGDGPR